MMQNLFGIFSYSRYGLLFLTAVQCLTLQPYDINNGTYDNLAANDANLCTRTCVAGAPPMTCYYRFTLEIYTTMGLACGNCPDEPDDCNLPQCIPADGVTKSILSINRRMPGPSIQVCAGDEIVIDLINKMKARDVVIHWHGIHQRNTPFMDGVPMITQCPILDGQEFRYKYLAERPGTYFYHAHSGLQKVDGLAGSLVIRGPRSIDPNSNRYDFDLPSHVVVVQDWMHELADVKQIVMTDRPGQLPNSYLINGKGAYSVNLREALSNLVHISEFFVAQENRYLFRIVGSTSLACPFEIAFESHPMLLIASDERSLVPTEFDSIIISSGERYDVVITTNQPPRTYWITVKSVGPCANLAYQVAALVYNRNGPNAPVAEVSPIVPLVTENPNARILNPTLDACPIDQGSKCISQLRSSERTPRAIVKLVPDRRIILTFDFHVFDPLTLFLQNEFNTYFVPPNGQAVMGLMNNVSFTFPPSPLLYQSSDIPRDLFCTPECQNTPTLCECLNVIKVPTGSVTELIIAQIENSTLIHPFHLHGHVYHVLTQGTWGPDRNATLRDLLSRLGAGVFLNNNLPVKDTLQVPSNGYMVVRVLFDNPGVWILHCHFAYHVNNGMLAVIQVGEENEFSRVPAGFPRCGNYLPPI